MHSFAWGGASATYADLRTAVYNTFNGTNHTIYLLENHSTNYSQIDTGADDAAVNTVRNTLEINCLGYTFSDPTAGSTIIGIYANGESFLTVHNCTISNFDSGIYLVSSSSNSFYNNTFESGTEQYGIKFSLTTIADTNISNNTFTSGFTQAGISITNSANNKNNNIWGNSFWSGGISIGASAVNTTTCQGAYGNFYNGSVATINVPAGDCGPTPLGAVYVNQSATTNFTWNGSSATYSDLRTAVFNTWNGTNNTVFLLTNHSTATDYTDGALAAAVSTVRNNVNINCQGFTFSDPTAGSGINGIISQGEIGINIFNCIISNFDKGVVIGLSDGTQLNIYNNTFVAGDEPYGIYFYDGDGVNITNNTFTGDYTSNAIGSDGSGETNTNIWLNQFWGAKGTAAIGVNDSFCINGLGNFYNGSIAIAGVPVADCGPTPNSNVSVNSSLSASSWSFSTAADANPIYKNLQEGYYNLNENKNMFLTENYQTASTTQTLRNGTTLNCQNKHINSSADAINIAGEFTSSNGNNIINSTFNIPGANDVYSSTANNNSIINSVFNRSDLGFTGTGSWIQVKWYVDVNVTNGTAPLANATVNIANSTPVTVFDGLTDVNGQIAQQTLTEFWRNSTLTVYETPHNVSGNKSGYASDSTLVNLTVTNSTTVVLNLTNILYPDLKINQSDITYTAGTIRQNDTVVVNVTIYNLGNSNATDANISFYVGATLNQSQLVNISNGTSQLIQFNWTALGGNHTLEARADPANLIAESNETNNNATSNISIKYVAVLQYLSPTGSFPRGKDVAGEDALFEISNTLTALARVYDLYNSSHTFSANCSFYFNETLIGTNLTNSSGYCSYTFDKTNYSYG
ncbi:right-handed parallel beta-helix repeat-containing protein, partial [Candidatus Woesearchaeota archaeon]|nr:right-handed parallel beta-helix repeat-containing protein [Candidatus Woesearchaeota archaeon]